MGSWTLAVESCWIKAAWGHFLSQLRAVDNGQASPPTKTSLERPKHSCVSCAAGVIRTLWIKKKFSISLERDKLTYNLEFYGKEWSYSTRLFWTHFSYPNPLEVAWRSLGKFSSTESSAESCPGVKQLQRVTLTGWTHVNASKVKVLKLQELKRNKESKTAVDMFPNL